MHLEFVLLWIIFVTCVISGICNACCKDFFVEHSPLFDGAVDAVLIFTLINTRYLYKFTGKSMVYLCEIPYHLLFLCHVLVLSY